MIVLAPSLLLEPSAQRKLRSPIILWNSLVTAEGITASSEHEDYPAVNLATDSMIESWRAADTATVTIDVEIGGAEIDAIGIARHNLGSSHASILVEARVGDDPAWIELTPQQMLADDAPALFRFPETIVTTLRVTVEGGDVPASIAVLYVGKLLVMPRGITAGHVPLDQAQQTQVVNGRSEAGHYLGRIITGQSSSTSAQFTTLPIAWYYEHMAPFVDRGTAGPFFFAWLPWSRPNDVGFTWLNSDPRPSMGSLFFDISLDIGGITW